MQSKYVKIYETGYLKAFQDQQTGLLLIEIPENGREIGLSGLGLLFLANSLSFKPVHFVGLGRMGQLWKTGL